MAKTITVTCPDVESGELSFYRDPTTGAATATWLSLGAPPEYDAAKVACAVARRTFAQLVTAGRITAGERTTLIALLTKVRSGLVAEENLAP